MTAMTALYTASATASGEGRNGHSRSSDGIIDVDLATPVEMGGPCGATNPEQLFAAGYAACFHSALKVVGGSSDLAGSTVSSEVSIGRLPSGGFGLAVALVVSIPALAHDDALALVQKAHEVCPYSNAIRGNVEVDLRVA